MNRRSKLVWGFGINDADYITNPMVKIEGKWVHLPVCPYYSKWYDMLRRCYSEEYQEKHPTYKGCSVCEEWKHFNNFKRWMEQQDWEGKDLDKDFLVEGNRTYSPSACIFIPQKVNKFVTTSGKMRGDHPIGVRLDKRRKKNPYLSQCSDGSGVQKYLGYFATPEQAHQSWLQKKLEVCESYMEEFKDSVLIVKGLIRIKSKIQYHIKTNTELTSF